MSGSQAASRLTRVSRHFSTCMYKNVELAPPDPILNTALLYKADKDPRKVNLGIGAYRTEQGVPMVLPVVKKAEEILLKETNADAIDKEYLPIDGLASLKKATQNLIFGKDKVEGVLAGKVASVQTLSGTGSLRVAAEFLIEKVGLPKGAPLYHSDPTWGNHPAIFNACGFVSSTYPYWDAATKNVRLEEMMAHMKSSADRSVYLIHPCAHNPTGLDPTNEQWEKIIKICVEKQHICILDSAYQGYASGSLSKDREAIRMFVDAVDYSGSANGLPGLLVCQSFAKNLGLYGERIGMLHVISSNEETNNRVLSQLKMVIRPMYSSPPCHGALLVSKILNDEALYSQWEKELKEMADRILSVRSGLRKGLEGKGTPGKWNHITDQIGMFSFTGLSPKQCERLIEDHHIYLLKSGRISLAGLNQGNLGYVVDSIDKVVREN